MKINETYESIYTQIRQQPEENPYPKDDKRRQE